MPKLAVQFLLALGLIGSAHAQVTDDCLIPQDHGIVFLPKTTPPRNLLPPLEPGQPIPRDCEFYRWAWQAFLYSTQIRDDGKPSFLHYATFADVFKIAPAKIFASQKAGLLALGPRTLQFSNHPHANSNSISVDDFRQANINTLLIDQRGNPIFYALHMNPTFVSFVTDYALNTPNGLKVAPAQLEFRVGSIEFKSAWMIADKDDMADHFTTQALVPVFKTLDGKIVPDGSKTRPVTVALIALHVVGVIEGHPEFIWATFEHVHHNSKSWVRDNAPPAMANPSAQPAKVILETNHYSLYPSAALGTGDPVPNANIAVPDKKFSLDATTQKFSPVTPIYRMFPSSQASVAGPSPTPPEDPEITRLNRHVQELFVSQKSDVTDRRSDYQLVAAVWLNTPRGSEDLQIPADFKPGLGFSNTPLRATLPVLGGEDRLSSTAMESFTQSEQDNPNCFSCHDTQAVAGLKASRLNVSHMLSRYFALTSTP
jgi:hypothetical protein